MQWVAWERAVGATVVTMIVQSNYGRWPRSLDEWVEVARRYGVYLNIGPAGTFLYGRNNIWVIFLKPTRTRRELYGHLAHELGEYLIRREYEAPYNFQGDDAFYHRIACYVQAHDRRMCYQKRGRKGSRVVGVRTAVH